MSRTFNSKSRLSGNSFCNSRESSQTLISASYASENKNKQDNSKIHAYGASPFFSSLSPARTHQQRIPHTEQFSPNWSLKSRKSDETAAYSDEHISSNTEVADIRITFKCPLTEHFCGVRSHQKMLESKRERSEMEERN